MNPVEALLRETLAFRCWPDGATALNRVPWAAFRREIAAEQDGGNLVRIVVRYAKEAGA